ncbi:MAG: hypothetical protein LQ341_003129 [Variospora aurantia]|nr:MAG: hypothetical protein LQ341_003129 [Variospora aurantia]
MDQTHVGNMGEYYGQQYAMEDLGKMADMDTDAIVNYMNANGMDTSAMIGGQTLDEIISQNNREMQRRQSFHHSQTFPSARLPMPQHPRRTSSMLEFGGMGNHSELEDFQFDPSAVPQSLGMQRPHSIPQRRLEPQQPRRRDAPDNLALNTQFHNIGSAYTPMTSASPFPQSAYNNSDPMSGLDMTPTYMNNPIMMGMDFSAGGLGRENSAEMSAIHMYSDNQMSPPVPRAPMHQAVPHSMRSSVQDPGGGPMDQSGDPGFSNHTHLQLQEQVPSLPVDMSQHSDNMQTAEPTPHVQELHTFAEPPEPPPPPQQPAVANLDVCTVGDTTIQSGQNMAAQSVMAQYKNAYSSSGFDMLGVLMRVAARPKPQINIGAVDMSCAFVVCDVTQHDIPIVYCSDIFERLTGYTKHEILGRNCRFLQAPDGKIQAGVKRKYVDDQSVLRIKNVITARQEMQISVINYRKGGQPFMNLLTMIPITWNSDEIKYYVGFQVDLVEQPTSITSKNPGKKFPGLTLITQDSDSSTDGSFTINYQRGLLPRYILPEHHPQSNTELGQTVGRDEVTAVLASISSGESDLSKRIWDKVLLENTDDVVHVLSLKGLFLYLSPSSRKVLEYDPSELVGTALSSVCHPSDIVPVTRELKDTSAGSGVNVVFRIRRKHTGYTWFESHGSLHLEQGKGRKCIIMVGRERPVYALARSDLDAVGGIGESELWTKMSTSGMFLFLSSNVRSLLDRQPEDLVATSAHALMRQESKLEFGKMLELARTGVRATFKHDIQNKRGQTLQARTTIYPGDASKGQKPTFLVAQTRLLKLQRHSKTLSHQADQKSGSSATSSSSLSGNAHTPQSSTRNLRPEVVTTSAGGNGLPIGTQHEALASEENVFDELKTTRSTSWQFELRQMEKRNRLLAEELQGLLSNRKKRKRRNGAGALQKDCANCHTRVTPEWRRGPSGNRDLCNSCGLRWAKENGRVSPRTSSQNSGDKHSASPKRTSNLGCGDARQAQRVIPSMEKKTAQDLQVNSHQAKTARMEAAASLGFGGGIPPKIEEGIES